MSAATPACGDVRPMLRGETAVLARWTDASEATRVGCWLLVTIAGSGMFGAAMGWWRAPGQALFTAVKFPLVMLLTTLGNALLNAMLAPLLGINLGLRQSLRAVLMSFTIAAAILGALSPLVAFVVWNTPPLAHRATAGSAHSFLLLLITGTIAFAGVASHLRLGQLLERLGGNAAAARRVLFAWLAGNLFLGSQLSWILRPFIGSPGLPVQFVRDDALHGSFFESLFRAFHHLFLSP
jgi:hypothetical protein